MSSFSGAATTRSAQLRAPISVQAPAYSCLALSKPLARNLSGLNHIGRRSVSSFKAAYEAHVSERASQASSRFF